jgi:hypothetical protein
MTPIDNALFINPCQVYLCKTEKEFKQLLKKFNVKESVSFLGKYAHATTHFLEQGNDNVIIVCIPKNQKQSQRQIHALLVHEAVHIWQKIRDVINEPHPCSEFEAYAIQNLCLNLFRKYET